MKHIVAQGECLASIAKQYGFPDWKLIYDDAQNAALRRKRPNPNILFPGDEVFIPDKKVKDESAGANQTLTFQTTAKPQATFLRVVLQTADGDPIKDAEYSLKAGEEIFDGTTKRDGLIEQEIPADAETGELTVSLDGEESATYELAIGHLDPVDEISGVKARLSNLGYDCGPDDDSLNEETKRALKAFQASVGLPSSGAIDAATKSKLEALHDRK